MRYWAGMGATVIAATLVAPWGGDVAVIAVALGGLFVAYLWAGPN